MSFRYCNLVARKTELQEMFKFLYTELKTNGFNVKQTALRDDFALALTRDQKWSSLLASTSDVYQSFHYSREYAVEETNFNEYSILALEKSIEMNKRKYPFVFSFAGKGVGIEKFLKALNIQAETPSRQELDKIITEKITPMTLNELYSFWVKHKLTSGDFCLYVFLKNLGLSEISKEALGLFIKSEWDFYFDESNKEDPVKQVGDIIEQLNELDYSVFSYKDFSTFVELMGEMLKLQTPKLEFVHEVEDGFDSLAIYINPFAFNEDLTVETSKDIAEFAQTLTLVESHYCQDFHLGHAPSSQKELWLYITKIYDDFNVSIGDALFEVMSTIDPFLDNLAADRYPLQFDMPEIEAFYAQLKISIGQRCGEHLTKDMLSLIERVPANPSYLLSDVVKKLEDSHNLAYQKLCFYEILNSSQFIAGRDELSIDFLMAEVRIDKMLYTDYNRDEIPLLDGIMVELVNRLNDAFGYEFTLKKVDKKEVQPWLQYFS